MDLNHLFLFLVVVSTLFVLVRSVRGAGALPWIAALVVLAITGFAYLADRKFAGWIALTAWLVILFLPALINNRATRRRLAAAGYEQRREKPLTRAVAVVMILNVLMFLLEIAQGGSTNPDTLHRLGELEPATIWIDCEYWRLLTALFLHYGVLHLCVNLYALSVIGPGLERAIGSLRFTFCYVIGGLGSSVGVVLLRAIRATGADHLVGASGCVMGLVGVWAGMLLRDRHAPLAWHRLRNILLIVALQTAFDLSTPQISMAAHLSGLATGIFLGLWIPPKRFDP